jgi:glycosyltransferase involved in cell wall biosynthesis
MNNKSIAIIGTVGVPAIYGGFETLAEYLTQYLGKHYDLTVYCSSKSYSKQLADYNNAKLVYLPLNANGVQSIVYDMLAIVKALRYADTLLILGVSGCTILPLVKLISREKIIVNIDGMEWRRHKWGKFAKWFLKFSEKLAVKYADVVITDNQVIKDYVLSEYGVNSTLIAYGGDHAVAAPLTKKVLSLYPFLASDYAFTVCRIEPENNIHIILAAVASHDKVPLVLVGNWQASQYGRDLYTRYLDSKYIQLLDPIYDQALLNQLRSNCLVYLHGHSAGGTNPSLVEAMCLGLPIFSFAANYNQETTEHAAQYFSDADGLKDLLVNTSKDSLLVNGQAMSDIASRRYQWQGIVGQYAELLG